MCYDRKLNRKSVMTGNWRERVSYDKKLKCKSVLPQKLNVKSALPHGIKEKACVTTGN